MKEQPPLHDPDLYARMSVARPEGVAEAAYGEFFKAVGEAREKYQIRDVVIVSTLAFKNEEGEGVACLVGYRGDSALVETMLARALGQVRSDNQKKIDDLAGVNRQQKVAKPKRRRADPSPG